MCSTMFGENRQRLELLEAACVVQLQLTTGDDRRRRAGSDFTNLPDELAQADGAIACSTHLSRERRPRPVRLRHQHRLSKTLNDTYRTWYRWFKSTTDTGTLPPPVSLFIYGKELREVWEKTVDNLEDAGDLIKIRDRLRRRLRHPVHLSDPDCSNRGRSDGSRRAGGRHCRGDSPRWARRRSGMSACLIYEQLYDAFQNFRFGVALNGLAFPMREHLGEAALPSSSSTPRCLTRPA
jgi:hypothetical protein